MTLTAVLLVLAVLGAPLFVIVAVVTALCWHLYSGSIHHFTDLSRLIDPMEGLITKDEFLAIPLFMASGAIMTGGGLARRLVDVARAALGWLPGGLAVASVAACMFFAAISGSSPVTLIAVGSIMFPAMVDSRYPEPFSLGLVMTAGSLGCLVPPAISMLIYAISVSQIRGSVDPSKLFLAGLMPAVFIAGVLAAYSVLVGRKLAGERPRFSWSGLGRALRDGVWALLLPVVVLGGIYSGLYTPSLAGAVAVVYSLVVTGFIYRELDLGGIVGVLAEAGKLMGMLILIIGLAFGLNSFLSDIKIEDQLRALIERWDLGPVGFMLLVNVVLVALGALMDSISATLIFAPMLAPLAVGHYGMDPLHFGVVFVVNMEIGYLMPPVATNLFVAAAVFKKPFGMVARAVMPTLALTCGALLLFMYVPTCSKGLVNYTEDKPIWEPFPWRVPAPAGPDQAGGAALPGPDAGLDIGSLTRARARELELEVDGGEKSDDDYYFGGGADAAP